jgi:uncharacterized protein YcgI (DUF1989 family)
MKHEYRIEPLGTRFRVIDPNGEQVGAYSTEDAAQQDMERCEKEAAMLDTAKLLVNIAVRTYMLTHDVNRETALYWIRSASNVV